LESIGEQHRSRKTKFIGTIDLTSTTDEEKVAKETESMGEDVVSKEAEDASDNAL
jgi:hypothetical protein